MMEDPEAAAARLIAFLASGEMPVLDGGTVSLRPTPSVCTATVRTPSPWPRVREGLEAARLVLARFWRPRMSASARRFRASARGDRALLVEFGDRISEPVHDRVLRLDRALAAAPFAGFLEAVPAYASLLVAFDPVVTDHRTTEPAVLLTQRYAAPLPAGARTSWRLLRRGSGPTCRMSRRATGRS